MDVPPALTILLYEHLALQSIWTIRQWKCQDELNTRHVHFLSFQLYFQVDDSYLIRYLATKSVEEEGLESSTLGLSFEVTDYHFAPTVHPGKREMWVRCEATMPPIEGMTFPFTREVFLGTFARSFDRYHATSRANSPKSQSCKLVKKINYIHHIIHRCASDLGPSIN
jgi:hypothetical protein